MQTEIFNLTLEQCLTIMEKVNMKDPQTVSSVLQMRNMISMGAVYPYYCICTHCSMEKLPDNRENICCKSIPCVTTLPQFYTVCLRREVIETAGLVSYADRFKDKNPNRGPKDFRKFAYEFFLLWHNTYLKKGPIYKRPNCVIRKIRESFPNQEDTPYNKSFTELVK